jgi:flagellar hook protein FlgE
MMRTSASGMAAQANRLGTVSDNIANSSTTGYKRASAEFSSFVLQSSASDYEPGSVEVAIRRGVSQQGGLDYTTSATDLAIQGDGFMIVSGADGQPVLTRAGSFIQNGDGNLVNVAGFKLLGYPITTGAQPGVANSYAGLEAVNIKTLALQANPSTAANLFVNMPSNAATVVAANLPSANAATAQYTAKTSLVAYDNLGNQVTLDVYFTKSAAHTWDAAVFDRAGAGPGGGFPYAAGALLDTETLTFDPATGALAGASPTQFSFTMPNGAALTIDLAQSSQLAVDYTVLEATVNGNAPSAVDRIEIGETGELSAVYQNGARVPAYRIPVATVASPDNMTALAGNAYAPSGASGDVQIGQAGAGGLGVFVSGALEKSTVDLASELTTMIESQRNYTANSKVFQTGAELLDVLVNLKR